MNNGGNSFIVIGDQGANVSEAKATHNYQTYGVLYNWLASMTVCPDGWHLPTDTEWIQLEMYLGMSVGEGAEWWSSTEIDSVRGTLKKVLLIDNL